MQAALPLGAFSPALCELPPPASSQASSSIDPADHTSASVPSPARRDDVDRSLLFFSSLVRASTLSAVIPFNKIAAAHINHDTIKSISYCFRTLFTAFFTALRKKPSACKKKCDEISAISLSL